MVMKLLIVLVYLAYAVQADPVCGENGWSCDTQNVSELNDMLQDAIPEGPTTFKLPEKTKGFQLQVIGKLSNIFGEVGGDKIITKWQQVGDSITGAVVDITDMSAAFSIDLKVYIKIFSLMKIYDGTISLNVDSFKAYIKMGNDGGKFTKESCKTTPEVITVEFENRGVKRNSIISRMMKRINPSAFMKGSLGNTGISKNLMEDLMKVLQSDENESLDINICEVLDIAFNLINSSGVGEWIDQKISEEISE